MLGGPRRDLALADSVVVVAPGSMNGWTLYDDQRGTLCTDVSSCRLMDGPATPQFGTGSVELAVSSATAGNAILSQGWRGLRLARITQLSYATFRQSDNAANNLAVALQLNVDYDIGDNVSSYQGRIVYEPYMSGAGVPQNTWQNWNTLAGKWWGTKSSVTVNGTAVANPCVQASPCTWPQLLGLFPNIGIHAVYGAVVLKAGSGWPAFRGNADDLRIGIDGVVTVYDFEKTMASAVPATPPNLIPPSLADDTQYLTGSGVNVHRNILVIEFGDTVSQRTRSQIVQSIGGVVVGGEPLGGTGDGPYYVRIADDPTGVVNLDLAAQLATLPTVVAAYPAWTASIDSSIAYRKPTDGVSWSNWQLDRSKITASDRNWASEAIRAPWAWGCDTGSTNVVVAVVDATFHTNPELGTNVTYTNAKDITAYNGPLVNTWHGDGVSDLIAARGNDHRGMTGVMWAASIKQWDIHRFAFDSARQRIVYTGPQATYSARTISDAVRSAARAGARVINLSLQNPMLRRLVTHKDSAVNALFATTIAHQLYRIEKEGLRQPLLVVASGNSGMSAFESGFPQLASHPRFGKNVIVVGASRFSTSSIFQSMSVTGSASNYGPLVSIFAPGEHVGFVSPDSTDQYDSGTSYAAPLVSGVAGLLFSFDPSLSAADVKQLILAGARADGRTAFDIVGNAYPFLDAYSALQAAAGRPGAPLCGNRVFSRTNGDVFAERTGAVDEKLFTSIDGAPYTDLLNVLHGGKRVQIGDYLEFDWNGATRGWNSASLTGDYHKDAGGAFLSWYDGTEHSGEFYAIANQAFVGSLETTWGVSIYPSSGVGGTRVLGTHGFPETEQINDVCSRIADYSTGCPTEDLVGSGWREFVKSTQIAFAPQGNFILVGANRRYHEQYIDPPSVPCIIPLYTAAHCAVYRPARDSSVGVDLWMVDTSATAGPWTPLKVDATAYNRIGLNVSWLAVDETGTEMVWELGKDVDNGSTFSCTQRVIEYRALPGHATIAPGELVRPAITLPSNCGRKFGPATFSPYRAGTRPVKRTPRASSPRRRGQAFK